MFRAIVLTASILALTGCAHIPVGSLVQLARYDIERADPASMRALVTLPRPLRSVPGRSELTLTIEPGDGSRHERSFRLAVERVSAVADGEVHALRIDDADRPKMSGFRQEMLARRAVASRASSMKVALKPVLCRSGELPETPLRLSARIQLSETSEPVPLLADVDLRSIAGDIGGTPPCS